MFDHLPRSAGLRGSGGDVRLGIQPEAPAVEKARVNGRAREDVVAVGPAADEALVRGHAKGAVVVADWRRRLQLYRAWSQKFGRLPRVIARPG